MAESVSDERPRPYEQWRTGQIDRGEDAAYLLGWHLIQCCWNEALRRVPDDADERTRAIAEHCVDIALHNAMDLLEGFYGGVETGPAHRAWFRLSVVVKDTDGQTVEEVPVSPNLQDLPIGYWAWRDGQFRGPSR